jgi:MoaA/NifB/PqqE/SkfB family radical SAM enzyme
VLRKGPDHLVFSLDSHSSLIHDYNRGVRGSFDATVATISRLLDLRRSLPGTQPVKLFTNSVLTSDNIGDLLAYADFATELGVDGCTFQVLSPTFHRQGSRDRFYERKFFPDRLAAIQALQRLRDQLARYPVVKSSDADLRWMQVYIEHPEALTEQICNSHERNMMVDHTGDVLLCFDMRKIFDGNPIGSVTSATLSDLWYGSLAAEARAIMKDCRHTCGMLNCHRRPTTI